MKKQKNGNIELMRFVFCWVIIFLHTGLKVIPGLKLPCGITFFELGRIGVEYFFLVSGFLMCMSAEKVHSNKIPNQTWIFIKRKLIAIFPYHIVAFIATEIIFFVSKPMKFDKALDTAVSFLPSFFLLQKTGIRGKELIGPEWYLCAMLFSMFLIYPLILKFKDWFTKLACPFLSVALIGYISHKTGALGNTVEYVFDNSVSKTMLRAFSELCLGVFLYRAVQYFEAYEVSKTGKIILTVTEFVCYSSTVYFTFGDTDYKYDVYMLFVLALGVAITFSNKSYFSGLFNNKVIYFLGKISLSLYLCQNFSFLFVNCLMPDSRKLYKLIVVILVTLVMAFLVMLIGDKLKKSFLNTKLNIYSITKEAESR